MISQIDPNKAKLYGIDHGVLINKVEPNSAAAKAGLKPGDIIVAVDGEEVNSAAELRNKIAFKGAGAEVKLRIYRNGKYITITAKLGAYKPKIQTIQNIESLKGVTLKQTKNGVVVEKVEPNSYAAMMGLESGDKILRVKTIKTGKWVEVKTIDQLTQLLKGLNQGDALLEVERKGEIAIITL
jgi:serine protease Do